MKKLIIVTFLTMLFAGTSGVHATLPTVHAPLRVESEIVSFDSNTNQVDLRVDFFKCTDSVFGKCTAFSTKVVKIDNLSILSDINWSLDFSADTQLTRHVILQLDPDTISTMMLDFRCLGMYAGAGLNRWFSIRDTLAMWKGFPYHLVKEAPSEVDWDTLSAEELAKEYEIRIRLRKDSEKEKARGYFGYVPEIDKEGYATMTMSLKEILKMGWETNLESYIVNPAEWIPTVDSPNHQKKKRTD